MEVKMGENKENICSAAPTLIFACSGAADVGAIADLAARKLTAEGAGKMYCLAGIGGRVPGILKTTKEAEKILAIDGCPLDCTKLSLEDAGISDFDQIVVTDLDLDKGHSPPTDKNIAKVIQASLLKLSG